MSNQLTVQDAKDRVLKALSDGEVFTRTVLDDNGNAFDADNEPLWELHTSSNRIFRIGVQTGHTYTP